MPDVFLYAPENLLDSGEIWVIDPTAVFGGVSVNVTGIAGTGAVGNVTVTAYANVSAGSVVGTGAVGNVTVTANASVSAQGVAGTGTIGNEAVTADANVTASGVTGTGAVGDVTVEILGGVDVLAVGVSGPDAAGVVTVTTEAEAVDGYAAWRPVSYRRDLPLRPTRVNAEVHIYGVAGVSAIGRATVAAEVSISAEVEILIASVLAAPMGLATVSIDHSARHRRQEAEAMALIATL